MSQVKIKAVGKYNGHSVKANKSVDLGLKFNYSELVNYIQLIQMLNENVTIAIKEDEDSKPQKIGMFTIKSIGIDHDGEGAVKFNSLIDYVEADTINTLAGMEQFVVMFKADIQSVDEDGEEE